MLCDLAYKELQGHTDPTGTFVPTIIKESAVTREIYPDTVICKSITRIGLLTVLQILKRLGGAEGEFRSQKVRLRPRKLLLRAVERSPR